MKNNRVTHLTSVHSRSDIRIFVKQCRTLAQAGYDVSLVVADGKGYAEEEGVRIYDVGASNGRLSRFLTIFLCSVKVLRRIFVRRV